MNITDGEPGDAFLCWGDKYNPSRWVIWKHLEGEQLRIANELGYTGQVVSAVLLGDSEVPVQALAEPDDQPKYMQRADDPMFADTEWTYLGKI